MENEHKKYRIAIYALNAIFISGVNLLVDTLVYIYRIFYITHTHA